MSADHATLLIKQACHLRWPERHVAGLAKLTRRSKSAAASWLSGRHQMPVSDLELLAEVLRMDGQAIIGAATELSRAADTKRAQPRRARGFQIIKDWDGTGVLRDGRWRGGRRKSRHYDV
jgi:hypothetical protein